MEKEYAERRAHAMAMGGPEKLRARRGEGLLNARERIEALVDPDSFLETGLFATSGRAETSDRTPADGKIAGFGRIEGRSMAVIANDFTVMGASSSTVNGRKIRHTKGVANARGLPLVFLAESTGARMPDVMGASGIGQQFDPAQYQRTRETPWVSAVLGHCYGSSSWYAAMSDFVVMRKGSIMGVSSPKLTAMATSQDVDPEELGGWRVHSENSGLVDIAVDSDQNALAIVRQFLSYLPSHANESPPVLDFEEDPSYEQERSDRLMKLIPEGRTQGYDMRKALRLIVDQDSLFELKSQFGRSLTTALARIGGRTVGVIANNPMFKGGAIDADACSKATSFIVLCDSFNIPLVFFVDQPGFLIGREGERKAIIGRVMNWMNALTLCTVPKISVIVRKTYGQAVLNMGLGGNAHEVCAWTLAEISFMDPSYAATIVYNVREEEDPTEFRHRRREMEKDTSAYDAAAVFSVQNVIDPRETRSYLHNVLAVHQLRNSDGIGEHRMSTWPTTIF
ncbi:MAG: acyl-CoA carboxylase subunit beta [Acidimicrobiales bacterium]